MTQLSDEEVKAELLGELESQLGRTPVPDTSALHYRAFEELIADLERRGWAFRRKPDPSGRDYLVVETRGS